MLLDCLGFFSFPNLLLYQHVAGYSFPEEKNNNQCLPSYAFHLIRNTGLEGTT